MVVATFYELALNILDLVKCSCDPEVIHLDTFNTLYTIITMTFEAFEKILWKMEHLIALRAKASFSIIFSKVFKTFLQFFLIFFNVV